MSGPATSPSVAVECSGVTRVFTAENGWFSQGSGRSVTALEDVSLNVSEGEVVGIAGPSGSGKSTLLHLLAGLDSPTDGAVRIRDRDIATLGSRQRAQFRLAHIGLVFQRFHLLPALTARENVALPLVAQGQAKGQRQDRAEHLLERVGLGDRLTHRPGSLSGGEQQRVAIARALAADPAVVIADEPTGELDRQTGEAVLDLLTEVSDGRAVIVASHDEYTLERTDRVLRLRDGRVE